MDADPMETHLSYDLILKLSVFVPPLEILRLGQVRTQ